MKYCLVFFIYLFSFFQPLLGQDITADTTEARILRNKADKLRLIQQQKQAIATFEKARILYQKHALHESDLNTAASIAICYQEAKELETSIDFAQKVIQGSLKLLGKHSASEGTARTCIGICYSILGNYDKAIAEQLKALVIFKELGHEKSLGSTYSNLGIAYYYKGDYTKALEWYKKYEVILNKIGSKSGLSALYNNTGALYYVSGNYEEALEYMNKALEMELSLEQSERDWIQLSSRYKNISILCREVKQPNRALDYLDKAESMLENLKNPEHSYFAQIYSARGVLLHELKDLKGAASYFEKEMRILQNSKVEPINLAVAYSNLSSIYALQNKKEKALEYINEAIAIEEKIGGEYNDRLITKYNNKASVLESMNEWDNYIFTKKQAIKIALRLFGEKNLVTAGCYLTLGYEFAKRDYFEEAFQYFDKALYSLTIGEETDVAKIIKNRAYVDLIDLRELLWNQGRSYFRWYKQTGDSTYLSKAYDNLMWIQTSITLTKNEIIQNQDKQHLLRQTHEMSAGVLEGAHLFYELNGKQTYIEDALQVAERNKSAILLEVLRGTAAQKFGNLPDSIQQEEEMLNSKLAGLEKKILDAQLEQKNTLATELKNELFEAKQNLEKLYQNLDKDYPEYVKLKQGGVDHKMKDYQTQILDKKTALLEYFVADSSCYLFVITQTASHLLKLNVSQQTLVEEVALLRKTISDYGYILKNEKLSKQTYQKMAYWFYQQLIRPAEVHLEGIEKLIVVPDHVLGHLPFEAFLTAEITTAEGYENMPYLINDYAIRYSYSASLLLENKKNRHEKSAGVPKLLAFASAYPMLADSLIEERSLTQQSLRKKLIPLPAVQTELNLLEDIFPSGEFFYEEAANESNFKKKASACTILHLAMHGILNNNHPIASSMAFTENGDSLEDNFLHAYEVSQLKLNADLVVLSACETGYGKFEQGEGVMSIARSFMYAGVPSLVVSLWQVNDGSTAVIMENFYTNLSLGMDKDIALAEAKKNYLKHAVGLAAHPAYWAPFIQLGDSQAIVEPKSKQIWWWLGGLFIFVIIGGLLLKTRT